jgi:hypothetical protein
MYRLIYKSQSVSEVDQETVKDIIERSWKTNEKSNITGALLATRTHFLQVLEGDFAEINDTFFRIVADPRHQYIQLISFAPAARRLFEGWTMQGFGLFDLDLELEQRLKVKYGEESGGICFPVEEWSSLSLMSDIKAIKDQ